MNATLFDVLRKGSVLTANTIVIDQDIDLSTEKVPRDDPRSSIVSIDPRRHSGSPCFVGTRVPIGHLWDFLSAGGGLDEFIESFPTVKKSQALEAIRLASERLLDGLVAR